MYPISDDKSAYFSQKSAIFLKIKLIKNEVWIDPQKVWAVEGMNKTASLSFAKFLKHLVNRFKS